ncbi:MAG: hypothetical protein MJ096_01900 [Clostridia bacterium]|nr:hypothetical protein [Clostridia bacterium]
MKKRIFSLLLILVLVMTSFVACGSDGKNDGKGDGTDVAATETSGEEKNEFAEIENYVDELASGVNYNGQTFTYIGFGDDFPAEEAITGELYNDAAYSREIALEEKFGIEFSNLITENGDYTTDMVAREVMAGGTSYDLAKGLMMTVGQPLMLQNALMDVSGFQTIDLSQPWWLQSLEEVYTLYDKLYFLSGSIVCNHFLDASCMMFNKQVAENYGITGIYDIVENREWTIDKMLEVASVIPTNTDGSGTWRFCLYPYRSVGEDLLFSAGFTISSRDEEGNLYIPDALPKDLSDFADKVSAFLGDDTQTCATRILKGEMEDTNVKYGYKGIEGIFEDNKILFMFGSTELATQLRNLDVEFGVIPEPMRDEFQKDYISSGNGSGWCVYVPKVVRDVEFVDVITEAMAALSDEYIRPAYLEKMLKGRSTDDVESRRYIDIVFNARVNDMIDIFGGGDRNSQGDFVNLLSRSIENGSEGLASGYIPNAKLTNRKISSMMKQVAKDN